MAASNPTGTPARWLDARCDSPRQLPMTWGPARPSRNQASQATSVGKPPPTEGGAGPYDSSFALVVTGGLVRPPQLPQRARCEKEGSAKARAMPAVAAADAFGTPLLGPGRTERRLPMLHMKTIPEASRPPASPHEKVRVEVALMDERMTHEVATELFRKSIDVESRGGLIKWKMDVVRIIMGRETARDVIRETLARLDVEDQWAIIEPLAEDLERLGSFRPRRRREI